MSYEQKIESAKSLIQEHNSNIPEKEHIDVNVFLGELHKMGGTSEKMLKLAKHEDLQSCGLPIILARHIANMFRVSSENQDDDLGKVISAKKAENMSHRQLLEYYNPRESNSPVSKRLKEISGGQPFIVFDENNQVIIKESLELLRDLLDGHEPLGIYLVDDKPCTVYQVGERPDHYLEENPLYPGRTLRSGGYCDQTNRSWEGISLSVRQMIRLALETKELVVANLDDAHAAIDKALSDHAEEEIKRRYPIASISFGDKQVKNELPSLKVSATRRKNTRKQDPFFQPQEY